MESGPVDQFKLVVEPPTSHSDPRARKLAGGFFLWVSVWSLRTALIFSVGLVLWTISRIPTYHDAQKISDFRIGLAHQLQLTGLPDLDIKVSPRSRGRGDIILETPVSPEKLDLIRREFDRLNVAGDYELKVRAP
ncbi:MAG: hypothetical protein V4675_02585 [Verrucomicrobiota bacterium]